MLRLQVIVGSTRPGRGGISVAQWFHAIAAANPRFDTELVDLAEVNLPLLDEPNHPRLGKYVHAHTRRWSATIARGDVYVFVTPEYNYGMPAALKNAIDYLNAEWAMKPVGFVSYGGVSGGLRSVVQLKSVVGILNMVALNEGVVAPFYAQQITDDGRFAATPIQQQGAEELLDALDRWGTLLRGARAPVAAK